MKKPNWKKLRHDVLAFFARALLLLLTSLSDLFARRSNAERRENAGARLTVCAAVFALTIGTLVACFPVRENYSELEQRSLTAFPTFELSDFLDGEYFTEIGTWFSDTFPFREQLVKLNAAVESIYGFQSSTVVGSVETGDAIPTSALTQDGDDEGDSPNTETPDSSSVTPESPEPSNGDSSSSGGTSGDDGDDDDDDDDDSDDDGSVTTVNIEVLDAILVLDDAAYEYYNFRQEPAEDYIRAINSAASQLRDAATVYDMLVPTSIDICVPESIRESVNTSSQRDAIDYFYASLSNRVTTIDVCDILAEREKAGDYLYFRTDHHWTALAAYYAYEAFTETAGVRTASLETDFTERTFTGFLGSFYRKTNSFAMASNPDTVIAYEPVDTNTITITPESGETFEYTIITDVTDWSASSKYASCFVGSDQPYSVIENPNITDGSSIVLVKESYGNCFAPFLVESYQTVYIVDYRYYNDVCDGTLIDLVKEKEIQDVLFLNTISSTRSQTLVDELTTLIDGE